MLSHFVHAQRQVILCLGLSSHHSHPVVTQHTQVTCATSQAVHILNTYKISLAINLQCSTPTLATVSYLKCTVKQLKLWFNIK